MIPAAACRSWAGRPYTGSVAGRLTGALAMSLASDRIPGDRWGCRSSARFLCHHSSLPEVFMPCGGGHGPFVCRAHDYASGRVLHDEGPLTNGSRCAYRYLVRTGMVAANASA